MQNRSKWDSPGRDIDESRNDKYRDRDTYHDRYSRNSGERHAKRYDFNRNKDYKPRRVSNSEGKQGYGRGTGDRIREKDHTNFRGRGNAHRKRDFKRRDDGRNRRSSSYVAKSYSQKRDRDDKKYEWGKHESTDKIPEQKEKPNFGLSGKLTEDANKVNGVIIKYAEPPEARKPKRRWRLYPFKGEKALPTLYIHRQSCYLIGRDRKICDLPVDHPSCSKQHAALQYRLVPFERDDGSVGKRVRPYLIDLESSNGTFINNKQINSKKFFELLEKDVIKFGFSSREYVLLHENSKEDQLDDDIREDNCDKD